MDLDWKTKKYIYFNLQLVSNNNKYYKFSLASAGKIKAPWARSQEFIIKASFKRILFFFRSSPHESDFLRAAWLFLWSSKDSRALKASAVDLLKDRPLNDTKLPRDNLFLLPDWDQLSLSFFLITYVKLRNEKSELIFYLS